MENPPFEDVFPIGKGEFPASHVSLPEGMQNEILFYPNIHNEGFRTPAFLGG